MAAFGLELLVRLADAAPTGATAIALDTLKASIAKATVTVKHLESPKESISMRAAENIIVIAQKLLNMKNWKNVLQNWRRKSNGLRNEPFGRTAKATRQGYSPASLRA
jgi:hypothetical protein